MSHPTQTLNFAILLRPKFNLFYVVWWWWWWWWWRRRRWWWWCIHPSLATHFPPPTGTTYFLSLTLLLHCVSFPLNGFALLGSEAGPLLRWSVSSCNWYRYLQYIIRCYKMLETSWDPSILFIPTRHAWFNTLVSFWSFVSQDWHLNYCSKNNIEYEAFSTSNVSLLVDLCWNLKCFKGNYIVSPRHSEPIIALCLDLLKLRNQL